MSRQPFPPPSDDPNSGAASGRQRLFSADQAPSDPTGVPGLDLVLGGGLPRGGLTVVSGPPGGGKTVLATQMAFAAAGAGRRALVLSALSESPSKLLAHLRGFAFFDTALIGDAIQFISLHDSLDRGLMATVQDILETARRQHTHLVVLDGFSGIRGADPSAQAARQFLYDLSGRLSLLGMSAVLTNEANPRDPAQFPEATSADVIMGIYFDLVGVRQRRHLEVIKRRGGAPLPGLHSVSLSDEGIIIYPQFEARVLAEAGGAQSDGPAMRKPLLGGTPEKRVPPTQGSQAASAPRAQAAASTVPPTRAAFGLPELDALLNGGLTRGTSTVLAGSIGTGKTLLGLQFALAGVRVGEPVLLLGFRESREQLLEKADAFALGAELRAALAPNGGMEFLRWDPVQLDPEMVGDQLLRALDQTHARRLVVDSAIELDRAVTEGSGAERVDGYMSALVLALRRRGVSALFIQELRQTAGEPLAYTVDQLAVLAENVLLQQQVVTQAERRRLLSVVKMRFSQHDVGVREYRIAPPQGIRVLSPADGGADG